jgi:hypothetical protein
LKKLAAKSALIARVTLPESPIEVGRGADQHHTTQDISRE